MDIENIERMDAARKLLIDSITDALAEHGKTYRDVAWVGTPDGTQSIIGFSKFAAVAQDVRVGDVHALTVVGIDWWMQLVPGIHLAHWKFYERPKRALGAKPFVFERDRDGGVQIVPDPAR